MKRQFNETIDGSIKNIIQLKTLDNSLEFSQMYDALEDTPRDFQMKLIDALNSLGETMQIPPTEAFNKVLCKSDDENEDVKKKLYNWWRAFFEVLGKVVGNMPRVKSAEFTEKMDDLMTEIMKAGDAEASTEEEPVMESSTKPRFKKGDFVVVRNGDDARVLRAYRDRVDKSIWYEVWIMDGNRTTEFRDDDVYASRKEYEAKYLYEENYEQATKDDEDKMMADMDFAIQHLGEVANKVKAIVNFINPYCEKTFNEENNTMKFKKIDEGSTEWVDAGEVFEMAKESDLENEMDNGEAFWKAMDDVDDLEKKGHWSGKFKVGDKVTWKHHNGSLSNEIVRELIDGGYIVDGGYAGASEVYPGWVDDELTGQANMELIDGKWQRIVKEGNLENELDKGDDGWVEIGQPVGESKPVELEGTDWKDITEKLTAAELADSLNGWEDRSKKLVVCDAFASGSDIVNVDVLTVTDKRDEVMKMASEYLLGNVENWQVGDASEPRKDENGQFYTELILKPKYEEVAENNDEVKSADVKDGDKQVTQDGETKTLVAGEENKKPVCEMTIEQDINNAWNLAEYLWGQGKENLEELLRIKLVDGDAILQLLEDMGERNLTSINDLFAYDFPSVLDSLGLDGHAWSQNLEFKRKGEEDEDDEGEDEG